MTTYSLRIGYSSFPSWRVGQIVDTWIQFGNTADTVDPADDVALNPNYPSTPPWMLFNTGITNGGQNMVWDGYCGGVFDPTTGDMYFTGGGHLDYAGNEVYRLRTRVNSPTFELLKPPTGCIGNEGPDANLDDGQEATNVYFDGAWRSFHSYDSLTFFEGKLYIAGLPAPFRSASTTNGSLFSYDVATDTIDHLYQGATYFFGTGISCVDTTRRRIYGWKNNAAYPSYWDIDAGTAHVDTAVQPNITSTNALLLYIEEIDAQICLSPDLSGGIGVYDYGVTPNGGFLNTPGTTGSGPPSYTTIGYNGRFYPNGAWVPGYGGGVGAILCWHGGTTVYVLTPPVSGNYATDPWVWSTRTISGSNAVTPPAPNSNGMYGRVWYDPVLKGLGISVFHDTQPYFYALEN